MTKLLLHVLLLVVLLLFPAIGWADFQAGQEAFERGDYATALKEWRPLAEQGNVKAQFELSGMYLLGQGMPQDDTEATKWCRLAAEQGDADAQKVLGSMYNVGQGVSQDVAEAVKWYRLAAEQGDGLAQKILGAHYFTGQGVPQDFVLAHMWINLAAAQGDEESIQTRKWLGGELTKTQLAEAQRLAREWKPKGK